MKTRLNLGCGTDIKEGWVNLDKVNLPGIDVVHNLEDPLPFDAEVFEEILCQDIFEHLEYIPVLREIYRVMKKNGVLHIRAPHFTSKLNAIDPTHKAIFSIQTFEFFTSDSTFNRGYYFDFAFQRVARREITFELSSRAFFYNRIMYRLVNRSWHMQQFYESSFLSRIFPAENIIVELIK